MNKADKYRRASLANFTDEQLATARANFAFGAKRFPEEHRKVASIIEEKGLGNHREVVDWYSRNKMPIPTSTLSFIQLYQGSTYAGPHGRGEQFEAPTHGGTGIASEIYRQPIKPDGEG